MGEREGKKHSLPSYNRKSEKLYAMVESSRETDSNVRPWKVTTDADIIHVMTAEECASDGFANGYIAVAGCRTITVTHCTGGDKHYSAFMATYTSRSDAVGSLDNDATAGITACQY